MSLVVLTLLLQEEKEHNKGCSYYESIVSLLTQGNREGKLDRRCCYCYANTTQNPSAATAGAYPKGTNALDANAKATGSPGAEWREVSGPAVENSTSGGGCWKLDAWMHGQGKRKRKRKRGIHQSAIIRVRGGKERRILRLHTNRRLTQYRGRETSRRA